VALFLFTLFKLFLYLLDTFFEVFEFLVLEEVANDIVINVTL